VGRHGEWIFTGTTADVQTQILPVGFQNWATSLDLGFYRQVDGGPVTNTHALRRPARARSRGSSKPAIQQQGILTEHLMQLAIPTLWGARSLRVL
jgi:hypothetical protein